MIASNEMYVGLVPFGSPRIQTFVEKRQMMRPASYHHVRWIDSTRGYRGCTAGAVLEVVEVTFSWAGDHQEVEYRYREVDTLAEAREVERRERLANSAAACWYVSPRAV